jgi:uncharacterized protein YggL (DUF469 family)
MKKIPVKKKVVKKAKKKDVMGIRFDMTCYKDQNKSCTQEDLDSFLDGFIEYVESKGMFCCGATELMKID